MAGSREEGPLSIEDVALTGMMCNFKFCPRFICRKKKIPSIL